MQPSVQIPSLNSDNSLFDVKKLLLAGLGINLIQSFKPGTSHTQHVYSKLDIGLTPNEIDEAIREFGISKYGEE